MHTWIHSLFYLIFPRYCAVCNNPISISEECICSTCNIHMPRTHYYSQLGNPMEKLFWGVMPIERAYAYFYYRKGSDYCHILHQLKYKGNKHIGEVMGRYMANEALDSGFFEGIDVIVPVPLHAKRLKKRGYNQSEWIARGIAKITGIPVHTAAVARSVHTETQTKKTLFERRENVREAFYLNNPELFANQHILLVDDVVTTGATTTACALALSESKNIKISVIAIGVVPR